MSNIFIRNDNLGLLGFQIKLTVNLFTRVAACIGLDIFLRYLHLPNKLVGLCSSMEGSSVVS